MLGVIALTPIGWAAAISTAILVVLSILLLLFGDAKESVAAVLAVGRIEETNLPIVVESMPGRVPSAPDAAASFSAAF